MKNLNEIKLILEESSGFSFFNTEIINNSLVCHSENKDIVENIIQLKKHPELKFRQLVDILAVDYPNKEKRFEVIYLLLSHENNLRITIKLQIEDKKSNQTLTSIFPSANWLEREVNILAPPGNHYSLKTINACINTNIKFLYNLNYIY